MLMFKAMIAEMFAISQDSEIVSILGVKAYFAVFETLKRSCDPLGDWNAFVQTMKDENSSIYNDFFHYAIREIYLMSLYRPDLDVMDYIMGESLFVWVNAVVRNDWPMYYHVAPICGNCLIYNNDQFIVPNPFYMTIKQEYDSYMGCYTPIPAETTVPAIPAEEPVVPAIVAEEPVVPAIVAEEPVVPVIPAEEPVVPAIPAETTVPAIPAVPDVNIGDMLPIRSLNVLKTLIRDVTTIFEKVLKGDETQTWLNSLSSKDTMFKIADSGIITDVASKLWESYARNNYHGVEQLQSLSTIKDELVSFCFCGKHPSFAYTMDTLRSTMKKRNLSKLSTGLTVVFRTQSFIDFQKPYSKSMSVICSLNLEKLTYSMVKRFKDVQSVVDPRVYLTEAVAEPSGPVSLIG